MRSTLVLAAGSALLSALALPAAAQSSLDERICPALLRDGRTGLFIAYDYFNQVTYKAVNGNPLEYRVNARFYFLPGPLGGEEGVWHIRTQTTARAARGSDRAYVYRPPVETRCSRKLGLGRLPAFASDDRFVDLNRYADHHAPNDGRWSYRDDAGLSDFFHFHIEDAQARRGCLRTDDRTVFRNMWDIYGFEGVSRTTSRTARNLRVVGTASAQALPAPTHDSLSSEFTYHDAPGPACFSFAAPTPTHSAALATGASWGPQATSIRIQRLRGRNVSLATERTISWR